MTAPKIHLSASDEARLASMVDELQGTRLAEAADALERELTRAVVVPPEELPRGVVAMGSAVVFADEETGETTEIVLVYPGDADIAAARVSVLTPVGTALLGLAVGDRITWPVPRGRARTLRVVDVSR